MGWAITGTGAGPPRQDGDSVRDEAEQVSYLEVRNSIVAAEGVDLAFWFTFAGYRLAHDSDTRHDLDMASCGPVKMLPGGLGTGYDGLGWEPGLAVDALAQPNWRTPSPPARSQPFIQGFSPKG